MRKPIYRLVAVLTFTVGVSVYLVWSSFDISPPSQSLRTQTETIGFLVPARVEHPMLALDVPPASSIQFMTLTRTLFQPSQTLVDENLLTFNCGTLTISIGNERQIWLGREWFGTPDDTGELVARIRSAFDMRVNNNAVHPALVYHVDLLDIPPEERIYKTLIIEAAPSTSYGDVVKIMRAVQSTGAHPIALQIGGLVDRSFSEE